MILLHKVGLRCLIRETREGATDVRRKNECLSSYLLMNLIHWKVYQLRRTVLRRASGPGVAMLLRVGKELVGEIRALSFDGVIGIGAESRCWIGR